MEASRASKATRRRVLVIAYYWPPAGGPGVQRWLKFAKYLPDCGWEPTLVVPDGAAYPVLDESLAEDVPDGLAVHRVPIFEPYEAGIRLFKGKGGAERLGSSSSDKESQGAAQRLMLWMRGNLLLPDPRVLWRKRCRKAALRIIRTADTSGRPFDAIVTTGPPHSVHLIGLDIKRRTSLPWLADFRDLWREMDYLEDFLPTERTRRRHAFLEREVVTLSDALTYTSPRTVHSLKDNAPEADARKFHLVYNGWDPDDVGPADAEDSSEKGADPAFQLGHFGSLFPTRDAPGLWRAIRHWNADDGNGRKIHLNLAGSISPPVRSSLESILAPEEWTDHGYMSHQAAVDMMQRMDALLLIQNDNATGQRAIPGKAFEYLATGRPMAIVAPTPSDMEDLGKECGIATCAHADDAGAMEMLVNLQRSGGVDPAIIQRFSRPALAAQTASILNGLATDQN